MKIRNSTNCQAIVKFECKAQAFSNSLENNRKYRACWYFFQTKKSFTMEDTIMEDIKDDKKDNKTINFHQMELDDRILKVIIRISLKYNFSNQKKNQLIIFRR